MKIWGEVVTPKYRPDIDGLRAIAVGGVVLYHAFPSLVPGGFVGVDIFFVISGYLITTIIASDALAGKFSLAGFYERRFRRIIPALGAMLIATTVAACLILPPGEIVQYGQSLIAVALFGSNILFWREGGYFDNPAEDKPLLHTWSLAVEEQFYILWPLIAAALVIWGRQRLLRGFVWVAIAASLIAAEAVVRISPNQAFYLIPYRAWELGFGALLSVGGVPALRNAVQREASAWIGLALIVAPMILYSDETRFPGLAAVPPCLGTLLMIHAGSGGTTRAGAMISVKPMLFTGLVSYAFYLWHWPVLVLTHIALNRPLEPMEAAMCVAAAFGLAALSLRYVERPFRKPGRIRFGRRAVLAASATALGLFASVGAAAYATNGFNRFASPRVQSAQAAMDSINPYRKLCHNNEGTADLGPVAKCTGGARRSDGYQLLLWGDSHADHLMPGLVEVARKDGLSVRQASVSGCGPLVLVERNVPPAEQACARFHRAALKEAARQPHLEGIVLSARWSTTMQGLASKAAPNASMSVREKAGIAELDSDLAKLIAEVRREVGPGKRIILVGSTPEFDVWPATCFARVFKMNGDPANCATQAARDGQWSNLADKVLGGIAAREGLTLLLPRKLFCDGERCRTALDGRILFRDDDHFTNDGSIYAASPMTPLLARQM